jgi:UDP-N-acetyl-2-amino-2-deoxyglucuronate dehydrogenase
MRVGILGTGAIANKHAQAYRNIGYDIVACSNKGAIRGQEFATRWGTNFIADYRDLCQFPDIDFIDVCTFPDFHLEPVEACVAVGRAIQLQKPIATNLTTARQILDMARAANVPLSIVSQHRFDDSTLFLRRAIAGGRLGKILQADAYVKWYRSPEYYSRPIKGSWQTEGGGALINQAIHQVDILLFLFGPVAKLQGMWQLGALHHIESEDIVNALLRFESGMTGVIQAATAFWPGYTERIEIHGTKGTAIISGENLTTWDVKDDPLAESDPAPVFANEKSGSSDPMNITVTSFERQFLDFGNAIRTGSMPVASGEDGYRAAICCEADKLSLTSITGL